uniref:FAM20 C-terminal domain-containing protein n=1 Tax=Nothobranchius korthausae TaxID=1143690 RepID=A0A1A8GVV6_9TELE
MILFRKFRFLILMVFLVACTLHIMIDLLPKLEKRASGADSGDGAGCQCAQQPDSDAQGWGKQRARSPGEAGWPNKHTLRILQDFSNEPSSNITSHSLEKITAAAGSKAGDSYGKTRQSAGNQRDNKPLIGNASGARTASAPAVSRLSALFQHHLYKVDLPPLTDDDTLFKTDIRFYPRATGNQAWQDGNDEEDEFSPTSEVTAESYPNWLQFHIGVNRYELYPRHSPVLDALLKDLVTQRITSVAMKSGGTQLKLIMTFQNYGQALFKPMKQTREQETPPDFFYFSDFERHNAEIAAFHLDRILGFRRAPLVVGRYVNLRTEIKPVATDQLLNTFLMQGNNTCFYGKCYYCRETEPACAEGEMMEGSLTLWLPDVWPLQKHRHPWGRTYREGKLARWEYDEGYCEAVKKMPPYDAGPRLMDVIDTAIFDYLIGNADRHHYESFQDDGGASMLILLDNAKSFGNPSLDERSILAPLYQCCMIRVSTWNRLNFLKGGALSSAMRQALAFDPIQPVLAETHLLALDRRLTGVITTVKQCIDAQGPDNTLIEDRMNLPHP